MPKITIFLVMRESSTNMLLAIMFPSKSFFCAWGYFSPTSSMESALAGSLYHQTSASMKRGWKLHLGIQMQWWLQSLEGGIAHIIYLCYGRSVPQKLHSLRLGEAKRGKGSSQVIQGAEDDIPLVCKHIFSPVYLVSKIFLKHCPLFSHYFNNPAYHWSRSQGWRLTYQHDGASKQGVNMVCTYYRLPSQEEKVDEAFKQLEETS